VPRYTDGSRFETKSFKLLNRCPLKRSGGINLVTENNYDDEEMTIELELDDGSVVNCAIITILTVEEKDYIALLPLDENGDNTEGEVWLYGYSENPDDPDEEPALSFIDDEGEYDKVVEAFDEYLDEQEFDELVPEDNW